ncbi:MAG: hypothetical protein IJJ63_03430 [Bacilli bacterium]|nr:hypothetical protein [Bacilli bacterium]
MNIDYFLNRVSEGEKNSYFNDNVLDFYHFVITHEPVCSIIEKLYDNQDLDGSDWVKIYEGLALMTSKAIRDEEKMSFINQFNYLCSQFLRTVSPKDSKLYRICNENLDYFAVCQIEKEIHMDLKNGLDRQYDNYILVDLKSLLEMHKEHANFQKSKSDYYHELMQKDDAEQAKVYRKALQDAYTRERKIARNYL